MLLGLVVIIVSFSSGGLSEIVILEGPMNLTVEEGRTARFPCNYSGANEIPEWYIRGALYVAFQLPPRHRYSHFERAIIVHNVSISDNGTTYRCSLNYGQVNSDTATLTVVPQSNCYSKFWESHRNVTMYSY